ncbi:MAG: NIPSNAP family protein [Gammaproteobacteria bacterium]|nr:NIPSNAP family protein [Gammaproteobacteria bacterium]
MFYELRQYKIQPGKMDEWVALMEEVIIPFQVAKGMVIVGSFRGEVDDTVYVWMRRFDSEAERERLYREVYGSEKWREAIQPRVAELMDMTSVSVQRIVPTLRSVVR